MASFKHTWRCCSSMSLQTNLTHWKMVQVAKKNQQFFSVTTVFLYDLEQITKILWVSGPPWIRWGKDYFPSLLDADQKQITDYQLISDYIIRHENMNLKHKEKKYIYTSIHTQISIHTHTFLLKNGMNMFQSYQEFWVHTTRECVCGWDLCFPIRLVMKLFFPVR